MRVTVGILTYRRLDMVTRCLDSVLAAGTQDCRVIVANNSTDEEYIARVEELARGRRVAVVSFRENRGLSAAWNSLARVYPSEQIIILNDDIRVLSGWRGVIDETLKDLRIGIISLSLANGAQLWEHYENPVGAAERPLRRYRCVYPTGSLLALRRGVFDQVGGFDENLEFGLEEVDFGIRACRLGYVNANVGVEGECYKFAVHYGSATGPAVKQTDAERDAYFAKKHGTSFPLSAEFERGLLA